MKKYLLSLLLVPFGIFAFSDAGSITITSNGSSYNPSSYDFGDVKYNELSFSDLDCAEEKDYMCGIQIYGQDGEQCFYSYDMNDCSENGNTIGVAQIKTSGSETFDSITISAPGIGNNNSGGGDSGGGGSVGSLLPGGETALSGAISGLTSTINEFIPLMVYVGLGVLGAVIGFFAIKWLIAYVRKETFTMFKK